MTVKVLEMLQEQRVKILKFCFKKNQEPFTKIFLKWSGNKINTNVKNNTRVKNIKKRGSVNKLDNMTHYDRIIMGSASHWTADFVNYSVTQHSAQNYKKTSSKTRNLFPHFGHGLWSWRSLLQHRGQKRCLDLRRAVGERSQQMLHFHHFCCS